VLGQFGAQLFGALGGVGGHAGLMAIATGAARADARRRTGRKSSGCAAACIAKC